jgi:hypothetical protein
MINSPELNNASLKSKTRVLLFLGSAILYCAILFHGHKVIAEPLVITFLYKIEKRKEGEVGA